MLVAKPGRPELETVVQAKILEKAVSKIDEPEEEETEA